MSCPFSAADSLALSSTVEALFRTDHSSHGYHSSDEGGQLEKLHLAQSELCRVEEVEEQ